MIDLTEKSQNAIINLISKSFMDISEKLKDFEDRIKKLEGLIMKLCECGKPLDQAYYKGNFIVNCSYCGFRKEGKTS